MFATANPKEAEKIKPSDFVPEWKVEEGGEAGPEANEVLKKKLFASLGDRIIDRRKRGESAAAAD